MTKTDLDRLHNLALVPRYKLVHTRRMGRTTYACHHCAGLLETIERWATIAWIIPRMQWLDHIQPMLSRILEEHEISYEWERRDLLFANDKRVIFVTLKEADHKLAGIHPIYKVDDIGEAYDFRD